MEHVVTCTACDFNEAWTTQDAAQAAAVQHVWSSHPELWEAVMGDDRLPTDITPPEDYGRKFEPWERQSSFPRPTLN